MSAAASLSPASTLPPTPPPSSGGVVSAAWVRDHLHHPRIKIIDASWYMPNEKIDPKALYKAERIAGAKFFDLDLCTDRSGPNAALPHMMPSRATLLAYLAAMDVQHDDCIVLYEGSKGVFASPRVRWTLQYHGIANVHLLDGGLAAWRHIGGAVEPGVDVVAPQLPADDSAAASAAPSSSSSSSSASVPLSRPGRIVHVDEVASNSTAAVPSFVLLDARSAGRFEGRDPEPRPGLPSGHIQGALNVPFTTLLTKDAASGATVLAPPEQLVSAFRAAGVDPHDARPIVASCGSGVTACIILLALERLQRRGSVALYDGAWTEWALNQRPIVTGKQ
jgi:thiosulfate/3-mercaptopyruvate sulfurtransferase